MDAYIHDAALYCADCRPPDADGPYPNGGGEADTPQHCDTCGAFLENPLTPDGAAYVVEQVADYVGTGHGCPEVLAEWWSYYRGEVEEWWTSDDSADLRSAVGDLLERDAIEQAAAIEDEEAEL